MKRVRSVRSVQVPKGQVQHQDSYDSFVQWCTHRECWMYKGACQSRLAKKKCIVNKKGQCREDQRGARGRVPWAIRFFAESASCPRPFLSRPDRSREKRLPCGS